MSLATYPLIGAPAPRIDGLAKVTGAALYGADHAPAGLAHAALALSPIARGRLVAVDDAAARALPGVLDVLTGRDCAPLASDRIHFAGQIVALVVAESLPAAQEAAAALRFEWAAEAPSAGFDDAGTRTVEAKPAGGEAGVEAGDFDAAWAGAPFKVDAHYETPAQHHNPMELFQATCAWDGDVLTVWESSQNVRGFQFGLARQLGIAPEKVRVLSKTVGGAFGSRGALGAMTAVVALAARRTGRPVKLVASRRQGFTVRTYRAETRHHVRLGCDRQGRLLALSHDGWELTARTEHFALAGSRDTARLYACPALRTRTWNVEADRQAPGYMRAPPETPYLFALECAMDELAFAAGIDPVELRKRNDTRFEPVRGLPYTTRSLVRCLDAGAQAFGWSARTPRPGSMRDGAELVGWGCASALYPTQIGPADARVTLDPDLRLRVEVGTHEIGTGVATVVAQTAAERLGLPLHAVEVAIGDSALPAAPLSAGSNSTASVCNVVWLACDRLAARIAAAAVAPGAGPLASRPADGVRFGPDGLVSSGGAREPLADAVRRAGGGRPLVEQATHIPHGTEPKAIEQVRQGRPVLTGGAKLKDRVQFAFGAHFVEVRIDRVSGAIRVARMVGAFAAGRIMNARTARSQLVGGQIWGASAALLEATEIDRRNARYVNADLAEYLLPVHADVGRIDAILVTEEDAQVNPLGIKGVGELGITGVNAAVANAVFHATGVRVRRLPIRLDDLLGTSEFLR